MYIAGGWGEPIMGGQRIPIRSSSSSSLLVAVALLQAQLLLYVVPHIRTVVDTGCQAIVCSASVHCLKHPSGAPAGRGRPHRRCIQPAMGTFAPRSCCREASEDWVRVAVCDRCSCFPPLFHRR
ncbi:hypothetical protein HPP92_028858 [Vanilla planifolia]|uniref:Uncharacterized protein n=1 Tax=Vanilla planifolia TaxID=51239 RepID=A0A835U2Y5_VANPL|nr:hypothetical protein HPP92_028858 [Vanilla planifolia]KAG0446407.1 hypothetical protein HPP92_028847 [Vanilla planifolia]